MEENTLSHAPFAELLTQVRELYFRAALSTLKTILASITPKPRVYLLGYEQEPKAVKKRYKQLKTDLQILWGEMQVICPVFDLTPGDSTLHVVSQMQESQLIVVLCTEAFQSKALANQELGMAFTQLIQQKSKVIPFYCGSKESIPYFLSTLHPASINTDKDYQEGIFAIVKSMVGDSVFKQAVNEAQTLFEQNYKKVKRLSPEQQCTLLETLKQQVKQQQAAEQATTYHELMQLISNQSQLTEAFKQSTVSHDETSPLKTHLTRFYQEQAQIQYLFYDISAIPISQAPRLALVQEPKQKDKEQSTLGSITDFRDERIASFEKVYGTEKPVELEELFADSALSDNNAKAIRLLILGRAGIGKTTLCQYIAHQWTQGLKDHWTARYAWIFWIPLRNLAADHYTANPHTEISLAEVIHRECFANNKAIRREEIAHLIQEPHRCLLLLDGYDEITPLDDGKSQQSRLLKELFGYPQVIVTSRPYAISELFRNYQRLENIGFLNHDIEDYIEKFFTTLQVPHHEQGLMAFLKKNPSLWGIAHIPINLELICSLWDEKQSEQQTLPVSWSMTELYEELVLKLYKRYLLKRTSKRVEKKELDKWTPQQIKQTCQPLIHFLNDLALQSFMQKAAVLIDKQLIQQLRDQYEPTYPHLFDDILEAGFIKNLGKQTAVADQGAYFLHLTFQEFFVADSLTTTLKSEIKESKPLTIREVMYEHGRDARYEIVWWFVAGLLRTNSKALQTFYDLLFPQNQSDPQFDLQTYLTEETNLPLLFLTLRCLEECHPTRIREKSLLLTTYHNFAVQVLLSPDSHPNLAKKSQPLIYYLRLSPQILQATSLLTSLSRQKDGNPAAKLALEFLEGNANLERLMKELQDATGPIDLRRDALNKVPYLITREAVPRLIELITHYLSDFVLKDSALKVLMKICQTFEHEVTTALHNKGSAEAKRKVAIFFTKKGGECQRTTQALNYYDLALQLDATYVVAWYNKGVVLKKQGRYKEALQCYEQALALDPKHVAAWNGKGIVLDEQGQYGEALKCYEQTLVFNPKDMVAWVYNTGVLLLQGEYRAALNRYEKALELDPKDVSAWNGKGEVLHDQGQYGEALKCYEQALAFNPEDVAAWNGKGYTLYNQSQYREALSCYDCGLFIAPMNKYLLSNKGLILLLKLETHNQAAELFQEALKQDPKFPYAIQGLELIAYVNKQFDEANRYLMQVKQYHEGIGKNEINARLSLYYAKVKTLVHFDLLDEARQSFQEACLLKPDHKPLLAFSEILNKKVTKDESEMESDSQVENEGKQSDEDKTCSITGNKRKR